MQQNPSDTPSADIIVLTDDIRGQTGFAVNGRLVCYALAEDYNVVNAAIDGTDQTTATIRGREIDVVPVETGRQASARDRKSLGREGMQRLVEQADPDVVISLIDVQMCSYLATMNRPQRATIQLRDPGEDPDPQAIVNTTLDGLRDLDLSKSFEWVAQVPIDGDPIPESWESFFAEVDYPVAMSRYGARVANEAFGIDVTTIRHGVDRIGVESNSTPPEGYDLPDDTFVVGSVNRNQFRKQYPRLIEAWGKFYDRAGRPDDIRFDMHCDPEDDMGWDLKRYVSRWDINEAMVAPRGKVSREKLLGLYRDMDVFCSATGGEGFGLCVGGDTTIIKETGGDNIADIEVGDSVLSHDGDYHTVQAKTSREVDEYYEVDVYTLPSVDVTREHPFLVTDASRHNLKNGNAFDTEWRDVGDLSGDEFVAYPRPEFSGELPESLNLDEIVPNVAADGGVVTTGMGYETSPDYSYSDIVEETGETKKVVENAVSRYRNGEQPGSDRQESVMSFLDDVDYTPPQKRTYNRTIPLTDETLRLFGWYLAEGSCQQGALEFSLGGHEGDVADWIAQTCERVFNATVSKTYPDDKDVIRVHVSGEPVAKFFKELFGRGAANKHIPERLMAGGEKLLPLLGGLFDGDAGCQSTGVQLTTASSDLAWQTWQILAAAGIPPAVEHRTQRDPGNHDQHKVGVWGSNFQEFKARSNVQMMDESDTATERRGRYAIVRDDFVFLPIRNIEKIEESLTVYDISVGGAKSFVGNGVLLHNTTIEAMSQGTPVIITDYTTSEELLTDGKPTPRGSLIPPAVMYDEHPQFSAVPRALVDTDAFANTLLEYYEDRERCRREGENAREWVTDALAFEDIADQWHSFISETVLGDGQAESRPDTATADD